MVRGVTGRGSPRRRRRRGRRPDAIIGDAVGRNPHGHPVDRDARLRAGRPASATSSSKARGRLRIVGHGLEQRRGLPAGLLGRMALRVLLPRLLLVGERGANRPGVPRDDELPLRRRADLLRREARARELRRRVLACLEAVAGRFMASSIWVASGGVGGKRTRPHTQVLVDQRWYAGTEGPGSPGPETAPRPPWPCRLALGDAVSLTVAAMIDDLCARRWPPRPGHRRRGPPRTPRSRTVRRMGNHTQRLRAIFRPHDGTHENRETSDRRHADRQPGTSSARPAALPRRRPSLRGHPRHREARRPLQSSAWRISC